MKLPIALLLSSSALAQDTLSVAFLGDRGHHVPWERCQAALAPLRARGIDLFYTEEVDVVQDLAGYDALLIYANLTRLGQANSEALVEWVQAGGALVPIHCASYCFHDSPEYVRMVGAQFLRHGGEVFSTNREGTHPLMEGLESLESWDETYVHHRHNPDRKVLATRDDSEGSEPWTWVREEGEGRVFYTAWGHDLRTWSQPAFHDLLARGIRWACGDDSPAEFEALPPLPQVEAAAPVPNYQPGQHGEAFQTMQGPLDPRPGLERMVTPPAFELELFASEPDIGNVIAMAWDERGRLFVAETIDYPNERRPGGGRDRIRILEDTDGDGRADLFKDFATGLSIPTSLVVTGAGVVVLQAPDTLLLVDHDGDDVADERRVLFTGWGTGDTHAGPSHLRYGFDGWLWGTVGYSGFRGDVGGQSHGFGQSIFRFRPDGSELEVVAPTSNNTWGLGFSEEGLVFGSTANGNPSVQLAVENRYYERLPGFSPGALPTIAERLDFHPVTQKVRQVDYHGKFTAAASHTLYTARAFPPAYWNRAAFVCAPTGHLLHQFFLEEEGSRFVARDGWNLVASDDEWMSPVAVEVGPDGAVWFSDWYSFIIQHNPTPPGFDNGPGNAYVTPLRDTERCRILRVVPRGGALGASPDLDGASALLDGLGSDNLFWRLTAQRLLVEGDHQAAVPALLELSNDPTLQAGGLAPRALHALYTLEGLGVFADAGPRAQDALITALRHPARGVRRAALRLLPAERWALDVLLSARLLEDSDAQVRLAACLALADMPPSAAAGRALLAFLEVPGNGQDRWLLDAATCAAARHDVGFLRGVLATAQLEAEGEARPPENVVPNPGMEEGSGSPGAWSARTYSGDGIKHSWTDEGRGGGRCLRIDVAGKADTSWYASVPLVPDATYRLSGWIKTEGLDVGSGRGAQFNMHEIQGPVNARTAGVGGDQGWTRVEIVFESGRRSEATVNCLFGGWGQSSGTAWFDDVRVEQVEAPLLGGPLGRVVSRVTRSYAARAQAEAVGVIADLVDVPPAVAVAFLRGLLDAGSAQAPDLDGADRATLAATASALAAEPRGLLLELSTRWGLSGLVAGDLAQVTGELRAALAAVGLPVAERLRSAERLVRLADGPEAVAAVLEPMELAADLELAAGLVGAAGASRSPGAGRALLASFERTPPSVRPLLVSVLTRRAPWTAALLDALESGALPPSVVDAPTWLRLEQHPDGALAKRAASLRAGGGDADAAQLVERFKGALDLRGDPLKGAAHFTEHCAKCHTFGGEGTLVGPELDGIGARPAEELLVEILDPNRSVEANFQLWTVVTRDKLIHAGRLASETRTTIELLDAEGQSVVLDRADLEVVQPSALSLMPAGFESLGEQGLADLLAYLARGH